MECFFINLENQINRRNLFLKGNKFNLDNKYRFKRFPAITNKDSRVNQIKGKLNNTGKAVLLSHYDLLKKSVNKKDHIWICEDDSLLRSKTFEIVDNFKLDQYDWDIIFTDVGIGDISQMLFLFDYKKKVDEDEVLLINLHKFKFFCLSSYIINKKSKKKILNYYEDYISNDVDKNLDLLINNLCKRRLINAFCFFPFISTINDFADQDGVNSNKVSKTFNLFRKLMFFEKKFLKKKDFEFIKDNFPKDDYSNKMSKIIEVFLHPDFKGE